MVRFVQKIAGIVICEYHRVNFDRSVVKMRELIAANARGSESYREATKVAAKALSRLASYDEDVKTTLVAAEMRYMAA